MWVGKLGFIGMLILVALRGCPLTRLRRELPQRGSLSCQTPKIPFALKCFPPSQGSPFGGAPRSGERANNAGKPQTYRFKQPDKPRLEILLPHPLQHGQNFLDPLAKSHKIWYNKDRKSIFLLDTPPQRRLDYEKAHHHHQPPVR